MRCIREIKGRGAAVELSARERMRIAREDGELRSSTGWVMRTWALGTCAKQAMEASKQNAETAHNLAGKNGWVRIMDISDATKVAKGWTRPEFGVAIIETPAAAQCTLWIPFTTSAMYQMLTECLKTRRFGPR